jgi:hypothetical protein
MGLTEFLFFEAALLIGVLATAGYGMLALPKAYFQVARGCFWAAAIGFAGIGIMWSVTTVEPLIVRVLVAGTLGFTAAAGLAEALRVVRHIEGEHKPPPVAEPRREDSNKPASAPGQPQGKYLRPDAEYLTIALRDIRNILTESVRDSSSIPEGFRRLAESSGVTVPLVEQLKQRLDELDAFYRDTDQKISAVLTRDRSYMQDLEPYAQSYVLNQDYLDLMSNFRMFVNGLLEHKDSINQSSLVPIRDYSNRVVQQYRSRYKDRVDEIERIDGKLREIRGSVSDLSPQPSIDPNQLAPMIEALRRDQQALANSEHTKGVLARVLSQHDQLQSGIAAREQFTGKRDERERSAAAEHIFKELRAVLGEVQPVQTSQGVGLIIKTAPNTLRVTFPVPMRIAPRISFKNLPAGTIPNLTEHSALGFTVVFSPPTVPVENFGYEADAEL